MALAIKADTFHAEKGDFQTTFQKQITDLIFDKKDT